MHSLARVVPSASANLWNLVSQGGATVERMGDDLPPLPPEPPLEGDYPVLVADGPPGGASRSNGRSSRGYDRVPPHSLEAEVSVLGAALQSPNAASEALETLTAEDFYRAAHRAVFEAILDLNHRGQPIDEVTVLDWLRSHQRLDEVGGPTALLDLTAAVPTAANAAYYAAIVRDKALLRRLIDAGTDVVKLAYESPGDARDTVDMAESLVFAVAETGSSTEVQALRDLLNPAFEVIEQRSERSSEVTGLATGFDDLDRLTAGLQNQNLIIIAARPAMGKSSLTLNIAHYVTAKLHEPVAVFNLEMSKNEIVERLLSAQAGIPSQKLRTGQLDDADWRRLSDALGTLAEAPLYIDDTPNLTVMEIRAKCRRLKQRQGLKLVIVDYLQLMTSHKSGSDNRQQEVAEISRGLKMLAKELDVPVIALSQLSRQPESRTDKRPMLADLRESGCLTRESRLFRADTGLPITFGQLLDEGHDDVEVWACDERGRLVPGRVTNVFPSGTKPTFRVTLRSGRVVEATANHPFMTVEGWSPLGELEVGSRVAGARRLPEPSRPQAMDPDELVLLAHLIGEGTIVARQPVHYTSADPDNLDVVEKAAWNRFGITARRDADGRSAVTTQLHLPAPFHLTHGRRNPIAGWLDGLGLWDHRSWEKFVPTPVFGLGDDQLRLFLHHLWATDGCIWQRKPEGRGPRARIYYATASRQLADDVQMLLLRLGIRSRIKAIPSDKGRTSHHVIVTGTANQARFLELVGSHGKRGHGAEALAAELREVSGNPNVDTIPKQAWQIVRERLVELGWSQREFALRRGGSYGGTALFKTSIGRERMAAIADLLESPDLEVLATDDRFWDEIVSIEPLGDRDVFDATVDGLHNFVCEGLILHNSIEQDADIVGFIYRDDVYNDESEDRGIAELIIAKHRNGANGVVRLAFLNHLTKFANLARGNM